MIDITISDPESKSSSGIKLGAFFEWQFLSLSRSKCLFGWIKQAHVKRTKRTPMHKTIGISQNTSNVSEWQTFVCLPFTNNAKRFFSPLFFFSPSLESQSRLSFPRKSETLLSLFLSFFSSSFTDDYFLVFVDRRKRSESHRQFAPRDRDFLRPSVCRSSTYSEEIFADRPGRKKKKQQLFVFNLSTSYVRYTRQKEFKSSISPWKRHTMLSRSKGRL